MRRIAFAFLLLAFSAPAANALLLSCFPEKADGPAKIDAYVDAFAPGPYPPKTMEAVRVLARFGEDVYEFEPGHMQEVSLRDGLLSIRLVQPLSAGETAEMRFEGKLAAEKGGRFTLAITLRNERRSGQGEVRCVLE